MRIPQETLDELAIRLGALEPDGLRLASPPCDLDPLVLVRGEAHLFTTAAYLRGRSREVAGLGVAWRSEGRAGAEGLGRLAAAAAQLDGTGPAPFLFGFAFRPEGPTRPEWDGFPAATVVLPQVSVWREPGRRGWLTVALPSGSAPGKLLALLAGLEDQPATVAGASELTLETRPSPDAWCESVADAAAAVRAGLLQKVVLARSVVLGRDVPVRPLDLLHPLREAYPACHPFGWQQGEAAFVGASPERLVARRGEEVVSEPLAGSAPRGAGEEEDRRLGEELLRSPKERIEHDLVVEDLAERLAPVVDALEVAPEPSLRRMATVQHLCSEIRGRLRSPRPLLELAGLLHPTPAVGGSPRGEALALIDKVEEIDRGWYAGGIGWTDAAGDGEAVVALRCALLRGDTAHLYAGAGIVAGSDPPSELAETRLKLRPLLDLLAAT